MMEATKLYQYSIPCGLSLGVRSTDSPTMALGLLKCRRVSPFSIADILGLNKSAANGAERDTENEVVPYHVSLFPHRLSPESPNSCTSDDRGYESSVDEPKEAEQNPIVLSTSRSRVAYSSYQVRELENVFTENQYPDVDDREDLARVTGLTEHQVKIWFQNRRQKIKKHLKTAGPLDVIPPLPRVLSAPSNMSDCSILSLGGHIFPEHHFPENRYKAHSPREILRLPRSTNIHGSVSTNSTSAFVTDPSVAKSFSRPYGYQMAPSTNSAFRRYQPNNVHARPAPGRRNLSPTIPRIGVSTQRTQHSGISIY